MKKFCCFCSWWGPDSENRSFHLTSSFYFPARGAQSHKHPDSAKMEELSFNVFIAQWENVKLLPWCRSGALVLQCSGVSSSKFRFCDKKKMEYIQAWFNQQGIFWWNSRGPQGDIFTTEIARELLKEQRQKELLLQNPILKEYLDDYKSLSLQNHLQPSNDKLHLWKKLWMFNQI